MTELSLDVSRTIKAPAEAVYKAWLDAKMLAQFMLPNESVKAVNVENEAKEGGTFSIVMTTAEQDIPHKGEYKVLKPFSEIVFTWESPFSLDGSTVTITLTEVSDGTQVDLRQVKFANEEARDTHATCWIAILAKLDNYFNKQAAA